MASAVTRRKHIFNISIPDRLPPLAGRFRAAFITIWGLLFLCAVALAATMLPGVIAARQIAPHDLVGLTTTDTDDGIVLGPAKGEEAKRSGIRTGDRLTSINGHPVGRDTDIEAMLAGPIGGTVTIGTIDPQGHRRTHRLTRDPKHVDEGYAEAGLNRSTVAGLSLVTFYGPLLLLPLGCAALLLLRRSHDPLAPWASLMMLLLAIGIGPTFAWLTSQPAPWPDIAAVLNSLAVYMLLAVLLLFPDGRIDTRWIWILLLVAAVLFGATWHVVSTWPMLGLAALFAGAIGLVIRRFRAMEPGIGRQQIRWALFAFSASTVATVLIVILDAMVAAAQTSGARIWLFLAATSLSGMMPALFIIGITVALLRYRLYDADVAVSRSITYGMLTIGLIGIFAGSEKTVEIIGEDYLGERMGALASGFSAALAAIMFVPLHHRLSHWAEHRFRKELTYLRQALPLLMGDLRETAGLEDLAAVALDRIAQGIHASHAALLIGDALAATHQIETSRVTDWLGRWTTTGKDGIEWVASDPVFPARVPLEADGHGRIGWLLLGPRPDGSLYGRDERAALAEIADPLARAVQIVQLREARETAQADAIRQLEKEMAALRKQYERLANSGIGRFQID